MSDLSDLLKSEFAFILVGTSWCVSCKAQENILTSHKIPEYLQKLGIKYFYIDGDDKEYSNFLDIHRVGSVPYIILMKQGKVIEKLKGLQLSSVIRERIDRMINLHSSNR